MRAIRYSTTYFKARLCNTMYYFWLFVNLVAVGKRLFFSRLVESHSKLRWSLVCCLWASSPWTAGGCSACTPTTVCVAPSALPFCFLDFFHLDFFLTNFNLFFFYKLNYFYFVSVFSFWVLLLCSLTASSLCCQWRELVKEKCELSW